MKIAKLVLITTGCCSLLMLTGCGSSSTAIQPMPNPGNALSSGTARYTAGTISPGKTEIPTHVVNAVTGHLTAELRKRGLAAEEGASNAVRIDGTTTYYRMRSGFARMAVGILAGKDGIKCDVTLVDAVTGTPTGKFEVSSFNLTAIGGEDDVARMLAKEIAEALEKHRK